MRHTPRPRRQVRPGTLRVARVFGFRYDPARDAYVLRLVGNRFGPVLKSEQLVDSAAEAVEWSEALRLEDRSPADRPEPEPEPEPSKDERVEPERPEDERVEAERPGDLEADQPRVRRFRREPEPAPEPASAPEPE